MRRQTITRFAALTLSLLAGLSLTAVPARPQEQERKAAPQEVPAIIKGTCPSPVAQTLTATTPNVHNADFTPAQLSAPRAWLNDPAPNKHFLYSFSWPKPQRCCQITKAILTVKLKANQPGTPGAANAINDGISIMHLGNVVAPFSQAVYTPPPASFPAGHVSVKQWTLTGAALANLNANFPLSLAVQDDHQVTSATLQLWGCCLSGPKGDVAEEVTTAHSEQ